MEWVLQQQAVDGNISNKIFFSDEANFTLGGYVNKQNCYIWGSENPQVIEERPVYVEKVTVWQALWSEGVIGPYIIGHYNPSVRIIDLVSQCVNFTHKWRDLQFKVELTDFLRNLSWQFYTLSEIS